ncbi:hypothetical protein [Neptuniibacter marinus]|uniref:hypothetical protein n=1 Tax=Neptuniibacter marinus TaxID=1806670 RepID=UPI000835A12F|nr:hypothetical protein [Neptuniibacter marinus]
MKVSLSSEACQGTIEEAFLWSFLVAFICLVSSAMVILSDDNPNNTPGRGYSLFNWLWPVSILFSSNNLSEEGRLWRPLLIVSILYLIAGFYIADQWGICVDGT